jgi:prepilin-type N-terminal cleavage/methylation domain-containing protein
MKRQRAFTLVELMIAISIIAVIASLSAVGLFKAFSGARNTAAAAELQTIAFCIETWKEREKTTFPPQPMSNDDVGMLADAILGAGPAWWDGVDGLGSSTRILMADTVGQHWGLNEDTGVMQWIVGDGVADGRTFAGKPERPLIELAFNAVTDQTNVDFVQRFQATLLTTDKKPVLYCPLTAGKVKAGYSPGYVEGGAVRSYPAAYAERKAAKDAAYILSHPGPDGMFYLPGGVDDDITLSGK